jgi:hypothetical protein
MIISDGAFLDTTTINAPRVESGNPVAYRLRRRNGELALQGAFQWREGFYRYGLKWRDIAIVELDDDQPTSENVNGTTERRLLLGDKVERW